MLRRNFLKSLPAAAALLNTRADAALQKMKINRIRYWESPITRPIFNQSFHVITVETDAGITGIGEGGTPDIVKQCGAMLIGEDASRIEHLWQLMYRGYFYPAGREKLHGLGGLDMALWDIKGKALGVPVYELLGGASRDYVECYSTGFPNKGSLRETARACMEFGFRAFRTGVSDPGRQGAVTNPFYSREMVQKTFEACKEIREGVGKSGDWAIDYHTRLDFPDAVRLSTLIEPLEPFFVEDLVRSENPDVYRQLRPMVKVPIAVGEQFGDRWDVNTLIENRLIDWNRVTLPNVGGITEYMKIAALSETHYVGLVPHFTGPIAEATLVHCVGATSSPAIMEMTGDGTTEIPYLPEKYDFKRGKMYLANRPGLGVTVDTSRLKMLAEVTEKSIPIPHFKRHDGSYTNW
jgi:galactonate dehydratase